MKKIKNGFTIIELVIVIAVIGILSAVLIPTFSNLVSKANETALQEGLRNAYTEYASQYSYSTTTPTLYSKDQIYYTTSEITKESDKYTIPVSATSNLVYYCGLDGKFVANDSEEVSNNYLGNYNNYYMYSID